MGLTAENLADRYGISREEQDAYSLESQKKALAARADGRGCRCRFGRMRGGFGILIGRDCGVR